MPELNFHIEGAEVVPYAATPQIALKLRVSNTTAEPIHTVALRCQVQLEVTRRRYTAEEQERLLDLFGEPDRWSQTLRSMLWTHVSVVVPSFEGSTVVDLILPCTFDFNVGATKYFHGLRDGDIPLCVMFSGTVFYARPEGGLQVSPIPWDKESRFKLPLRSWRSMMDAYYPNSAWLCLQRDAFERLYQFKVQHGIPTWEQALERLMPVDEVVGS